MTNPISLIPDLTKPIDTLIAKISDAIGGAFKPTQIRRVAAAEADAQKIKANAQIEINELEERARHRMIQEQVKQQSNMDSITAKAIGSLNDDARPENMEDDWIAYFFDKSRLTSDEEMQNLWAKILAGEANSPGTYSKRTINLLSSLDKSDALLFTQMCSFVWRFPGDPRLMILSDNDDIYASRGITFESVQHLDGLGLVRFQPLQYRVLFKKHGLFPTAYFNHNIVINITEGKDKIMAGNVMLSAVGKELLPICGSEPIPEFLDYVMERWTQAGYEPYSPFPRGNI
jgi:hypothetical protein